MSANDSAPPQIIIHSSNIETANSAPPPVYESAIDAPSADMPPTYESLTMINKLKKAKEDANNPVEYLSSACAIICGSCAITVVFAISIALPITMIILGTIYKDDCTYQKNIPIWLIVAGSFGCLSSVLRTISNCYSLLVKRDQNDPENANKINKKSCLTSLIELFLFAWFIAGNVWVYSIRSEVSFTPGSEKYCHQTVYLFSFWIITISWILTVFFCCCCCCIIFIAGCGMGIAEATSSK